VFTFDVHQRGIYPIPKEQNDLDIALPGGIEDDEYLALLRQHLPWVFDRARPDLAILQGGVDVLDGDPLASFCLSPEGIITRDALVFAEAARRDVPIVLVLGGGYSDRAWAVQYGSIRNLIEEYGVRNRERPYPSRSPSVKEKVYTK
jgi:histone deacetylase 11